MKVTIKSESQSPPMDAPFFVKGKDSKLLFLVTKSEKGKEFYDLIAVDADRHCKVTEYINAIHGEVGYKIIHGTIIIDTEK